MTEQRRKKRNKPEEMKNESFTLGKVGKKILPVKWKYPFVIIRQYFYLPEVIVVRLASLERSESLPQPSKKKEATD